jgi:hypothetical protein
VALLLHVAVFGHGGIRVEPPGELADAIQDDLGSSVIKFGRAMDFDYAAREAADIADIVHSDGKTTTENRQAARSSQKSMK